MNYGERLRLCREKKGLTQKFVAEKIGVKNNTLHGYESGKYEPSFETLVNLANLYDVTTDYLLGRSSHSKMTEKEDREFDKKTLELIETVESLPDDLKKQFWENARLMKKHLEKK